MPLRRGTLFAPALAGARSSCRQESGRAAEAGPAAEMAGRRLGTFSIPTREQSLSAPGPITKNRKPPPLAATFEIYRKPAQPSRRRLVEADRRRHDRNRNQAHRPGCGQSRPSRRANSKAAATKIAAGDFSVLAVLLAVAAEYDGDVRWQDAAPGASRCVRPRRAQLQSGAATKHSKKRFNASRTWPI